MKFARKFMAFWDFYEDFVFEDFKVAFDKSICIDFFRGVFAESLDFETKIFSYFLMIF